MHISKDTWTVPQSRQLIAVFKSFSNLWDKRNKFNRNKVLREHCLRNITKQMLQIKPGIAIEDIRCKLGTLRSQYAREKRRKEEAIAQGWQFKPTLWCYEEIKFIDPENAPDEAITRENELWVTKFLEAEKKKKPVKIYKPRGGHRVTTWSKEHVYNLLMVFKSHPLIYDSTHPLYANPIHRSKAWRDMKIALEADRPNMTMDQMRYKLKSLRKQYLKEKRLEKQTRNCRGGLPYTPKLWCFKLMKFWDEKGRFLEKGQDMNKDDEDDDDDEKYEVVNQEPEFQSYEAPEDCFKEENESEIYGESFDHVSENEDTISSRPSTSDTESFERDPSMLHRKCLNLIETISKQIKTEKESDECAENVRSKPETLLGIMVEMELAQLSEDVLADAKWKIIKVLEEASKKQRDLTSLDGS